MRLFICGVVLMLILQCADIFAKSAGSKKQKADLIRMLENYKSGAIDAFPNDENDPKFRQMLNNSKCISSRYGVGKILKVTWMNFSPYYVIKYTRGKCFGSAPNAGPHCRFPFADQTRILITTKEGQPCLEAA